jgi:Fe-S-cluster-containing dehydrogenase component
MKALNPGVHKTAPDQRLVIKSQKRVDMGPFMRYSCWHCTNPPCVKRCPFEALAKMPNGAVRIDPAKCSPDAYNPANGKTCTRQCSIDCGRGGYPKVGDGSDLYDTPKSWKCTLCYGRAGADADLDAAYGNPLPTKVYPDASGNYISPISGTAVADLKHQPSCVFTCPAKAMVWDTKDNIVGTAVPGSGYLNDPKNGFISAQGDGSIYWASRKNLLIAPKADPFIEDHVTPLVSSVISGPYAKAALLPTILAGGLVAVIARRQQLADPSIEEV